MTTEFHELIAALDSYLMMDGRDETPMAERVARLMEAKRKCFDALAAEPAPAAEGGPSDEDLAQLLFDDHRSAIEFACDLEAEGKIMVQSHIEFARAVLARYGTAAPPEAQP